MCAACCLLLECSSRLVLLRMVYSDYVKQRIFAYYRCKKNCTETARCLAEEGHSFTKVGVVKFLHCYKETGSISHKPGTSWASKVTASIHDTIKKQIEKDWCAFLSSLSPPLPFRSCSILIQISQDSSYFISYMASLLSCCCRCSYFRCPFIAGIGRSFQNLSGRRYLFASDARLCICWMSVREFVGRPHLYPCVQAFGENFTMTHTVNVY